MEPDELALPRAIALTWGVAERPQRGPKRELSIERIVEAAMAIADAEGLAAVSMSRVATSLGFTTMSLYRYVTSKDDLLLLMQDAACWVAVPEADPEQGWRDGLRQWFALVRQVYRAHPWFADLPVTSVPVTPNNLIMADEALRALRDLALSDAEKIAVLLLVSTYSRAVGSLERDLLSAHPGAATIDATGPRYGAILRELVTPERFPYLAPLVASGAYTGEDTENNTGVPVDDFQFGLERILDGIEKRLADAPDGGAAGGSVAGGSVSGGSVSVGTDSLGGAASPIAAQVEASFPSDPKVKAASKARREAESALREARKREREAIRNAADRAKAAAEKQAALTAKATSLAEKAARAAEKSAR
jgi:AcrR family transcriptional regulator